MMTTNKPESLAATERTERLRVFTKALAAHNLERIGDCITNIAERVIYAATGRLEELNVQRPV